MSVLNTYSFPKNLNLNNSINFANHIAGLQPESSYTFDFGNIEFVYPFGALLTCLSIRSFRKKHANTNLLININDSNGTSYAKRMGFFHASGFPIGDPPNSYQGPTYLPICITDTVELRRGSIPEAEHVQNLSKQLASRLLQDQIYCIAEQTVAYSFQEIVRNVFEHSSSDFIAYCAQFYGKKNEVEIAIADMGVGLRCSLSRNPKLSHISESEALEYALIPGVSGTIFHRAKKYHTEPLANAGLGLYMLYRLCNEGGEFIIASGQSALHKRSTSDHQLIRVNYPGTIVGIRLPLDNTCKLEALQKQYSAEVQNLINQITCGQLPGQDKVSSLLSANFSNANSEIMIGSRVKHPKKGAGTVVNIFTEHSQEVARVSLDGGGEQKIAISRLIYLEE